MLIIVGSRSTQKVAFFVMEIMFRCRGLILICYFGCRIGLIHRIVLLIMFICQMALPIRISSLISLVMNSLFIITHFRLMLLYCILCCFTFLSNWFINHFIQEYFHYEDFDFVTFKKWYYLIYQFQKFCIYYSSLNFKSQYHSLCEELAAIASRLLSSLKYNLAILQKTDLIHQ